MTRLRLLLVLAAAALCTAGPALAADPTAGLPDGWSHAEINVTGPKGQSHTLIFDRGRVVSIGTGSVTIDEPDGSVVTVAVAPRATVLVNSRRARLLRIRPGFHVVTRGVDGRPAQLVRAKRPVRKPV
jgi:hypothetical protein